MSHPLWTLYNSVTEQTVENLDVPGAVTALSTYSTEELAVWFAWHEGLSDWKPILELPEFAGQFQSAPPEPAKPALSLVTEPSPVEPAPQPWEPEVFAEDLSEKTAFGYSPQPGAPEPAAPQSAAPESVPVESAILQQDEITKTVEVTVTNFEVTEVTEVTAMGYAPAPEAVLPTAPHPVAPQPATPEPAAPEPVALPPTAPAFEVPAAAWTAPVAEEPPVHHEAPQPAAPQPAAPQPAATPDDGTHVYWMTEGPDGQMQPATLDEMTGSHVHTAAAPVILSEESEHLAAQAESMPEHGDSVVAKVGTPSRQASFPLASGSAPGETPASSASNSSGADRRKYPRFDIRYRVIVRNDNLTFRTFSRNISLGGVALEMPVPEALLGSECQIYVGNPRTGENIRFSGKLVANRNDSQFFVFLKSSPDSLTKLQKWVEAHQSHSKRAG